MRQDLQLPKQVAEIGPSMDVISPNTPSGYHKWDDQTHRVGLLGHCPVLPLMMLGHQAK